MVVILMTSVIDEQNFHSNSQVDAISCGERKRDPR